VTVAVNRIAWQTAYLENLAVGLVAYLLTQKTAIHAAKLELRISNSLKSSATGMMAPPKR